MRILHRYILKEILKALLLALGAVSGIICFAMVLQALQERGLGPLTSLLFMGLSIPGAAYIAMPLAAVLAGTLVYGRLAAENEVMACRASGIPLSSLFWPGLLLAVFSSVTVLLLAAWPLPASKYSAKHLARANIERHFFSKLNISGKIKVEQANFEMTVDRVVGDMLYGPTLKYRGRGGQTYCYAPYGRVDFDAQLNRAELTLWDAVVLDEDNAVPVRGTHRIGVTIPTLIPREEDDLSLWHLMAVQRRPELADRIAMLPEDATPETIRREKIKVRTRAIAEFHGRLATAFGCFGLVLIGAGLGVYFHSGHLLTAFGVALVPWMASSLLTMAAVKQVARAGENPQDQIWLIWLPEVAAVGLGLLVVAYLSWVWPSPRRWRDSLRGGRG